MTTRPDMSHENARSPGLYPEQKAGVGRSDRLCIVYTGQLCQTGVEVEPALTHLCQSGVRTDAGFGCCLAQYRISPDLRRLVEIEPAYQGLYYVGLGRNSA